MSHRETVNLFVYMNRMFNLSGARQSSQKVAKMFL